MRGKKYSKIEKDQAVKDYQAGQDLKSISSDRKIPVPTLKKWMASERISSVNGTGKKEIVYLTRKVAKYEAIIIDQADTIRSLKNAMPGRTSNRL